MNSYGYHITPISMMDIHGEDTFWLARPRMSHGAAIYQSLVTSCGYAATHMDQH